MIRHFAALALLVAAITASPLAGNLKKPKEDINYRLPGDVIPVSYNIRLIPYLEGEGEKEFTFDGTVSIRVQALAATSVITLHSNQLVFVEEETKVLNSAANDTEFPIYLPLILDTDRHFLTINLENPLTRLAFYEIRLNFTGVLNEEMSGFYRSSYAEGDTTKWLATTQFESTDARKAFPCFDEPSLKATFDISVARKDGQTVLSNMPRRGDPSAPDPAIGNRIWVTFETTPIMSSYLIAFIVSEFESLKNDDNTFGVWARREAIGQAQYAMDIGPHLLQHLRDFVDMSYEVPKVDNVAISDFSAGAMENWGLVTYREASLLFDNDVSTELNKQRVARVIGHEFAHFWFGDLVTLGWWEYAWLNEGFAAYFEVISVDMENPGWELVDQFVVDTIQPILLTDSVTTTLQLSQPCASPAEIDANFGSITYDKGSAVLRMIDNVLTRPTFQKGLQNYLKTYQHTGVTPDQLFAEWDKVAETDNVLADGVTVKKIMDSWTLKPGNPYITVAGVSGDTSTLVITQNRVLLQADTANPDTSLWWVPLTWTRKSDDSELYFKDTKPKEWLKEEKYLVLPTDIAADEWVIFNNQQTGFYRVAYDSHYWALILEALQNEQEYTKIHELNRAQIVDDALNLARIGAVDYKDALEATLYLKQETAYGPWMAAFNGFSFLDTKLVGSAGFESFKSYVLLSMNKLYTTLTFDSLSGSESQKIVLSRARALKWACLYGLEDCVTHALNEFNDWVETPDKRVSSNRKDVVYCTALREGPTENWDFLWSQYLTANVAADQNTILAALGCTKDQTQLNDYLLKSVTDDSGIRRQDAPSVFSSVYNNAEGVDTALDFLVGNLPAISTHYLGFNTLGNSITGLGSKLTTQAQVDKLREFVETNADVLSTTSAYIAAGKAIETAEADLEWASANSQTILDWMQAQAGTGAGVGAAHSLQATSMVVLLAAVIVNVMLRLR